MKDRHLVHGNSATIPCSDNDILCFPKNPIRGVGLTKHNDFAKMSLQHDLVVQL